MTSRIYGRKTIAIL